MAAEDARLPGDSARAHPLRRRSPRARLRRRARLVIRRIGEGPWTVVLLVLAMAFVPTLTGLQGANQIQLVGNVLSKCTLTATPDALASNIPLALGGAQRIRIGAIGQTCNGRTGYRMEVLSSNCLAAPVGAKLLDTVSGEYLPYAVESENPTTGGSAPLVTGLLASACTGQVARDVTNAIINGQSSTFYIAFTGSSSLSAGTYHDIVTVTLTTK